ncbi:MAG: serine hydrolase [Psychroserpens sp.]|nr:serine hydrolase [Psychroserpens sp.]
MLSYTLNSQSIQSIKEDLLFLSKQFKDSLNFNGSLFVAKNNEVLLDKSYGYSNFEHLTRITNETPFRIASVSKMFTSYAIYILASQSKLGLEDKVVKYIPELQSKFNDIKISHILNHRSGLSRTVDNYLESAPHLTYSSDEIINAVNKTDLAFHPDESFQYSNVGYSLLGLIIESVTNQSYKEAMNTLIFAPLDLKQTSHEVESQIFKGLASGYNFLEGKTLKSEHENKSHVLAAGSIISSISDLYCFSQEILKGTLLTKELHQQYLTLDQNFRTHGGLITWNYTSKFPLEKEEGQIVMHSGLCPGFSSTVAIFLEHNLIVIGLSNRNPIDMSKVYNILGNVALGFEKEEVNTPTIGKLNALIINGEFYEALKQYKALLNKDDALKIKAAELNNLGYGYLQYQMYDKAINVFTFFTMVYPENANAYDSLGEAYVRDNNTDQAIKAYKKAIELNPNNSQAKMVLQSLVNQQANLIKEKNE